MSKCMISGRVGGDQRGMALVSALLLLLVVSLLAVGLSMDSSMDVRTAAYQHFKERAFTSAEAALVTSGDILEDNIYEAGWTGLSDPFSFPNLSDKYDDLVAGDILIHGDGLFYLEENPKDPDADTVMTMTGEIQASVITQRVVSKAARGGAMQVAAGYAGTGKGLGGGGAHILYNIEATGTDADQAQYCLGADYRYVTK